MLALIQNNSIIQTIHPGGWFDLPNGSRASPAHDGWTDGEHRLAAILPADPVPEGKRIVATSILNTEEGWKTIHTLEDIPPPTPEEIRANMPQLSMVDFRRKLRGIKVIQRFDENGNPDGELDGIYEEDILEKIDLIADKELAAEARDYFLYAQYIERINPWVEILGSMFGLTPEEIDIFWMT